MGTIERIKQDIIVILLWFIEKLDKRLSHPVQQALSILKSGELSDTDLTAAIEDKIKQMTAGVSGDPLIIETQAYLRLMGFPIGSFGPNQNGIDAKYGDATREALGLFERMHQIEPTGEITPTTLALLEKQAYNGANFRQLVKEAWERGVRPDIGKAVSKAAFVNVIYYYAVIDEFDSKVPAAVTTAQAILESGYGQSVPVDVNTKQYSYNLFGIKGTGPAGSVNSWTREETSSGIWEPQLARFKAFHSFEESIKGHSQFFYDNLKRYGAAFQTNNPKDFAREIARAGYATDSKYADKLIYLIDYWGLV